MGVLTFNGTASSVYGLYVRGKDTFNAPELDYTAVSVPGKSGDIILSNGRYKNLLVPYEAYIHKDFKTKAQNVRAWLLSPQGYCRLTDEFNEGEYRLAMFKGPLDFDMRLMNRSGTCTLLFDCKPQRFLVSGERAQNFTGSGGTIINPTAFEALPLITVTSGTTGAAKLSVNGYSLNISQLPAKKLALDCETQNAYNGLTNLNRTVSGQFPKLSPGVNEISWSGSITGVSITARWWTL